ncbi:MAG TPA: GrpB family protein [Deinococcales bacterium]|nr:GrpB family protein [Deinococcales bacterium]
MRTIQVVPHDPAWPRTFERLREPIAAALAGLPATVEHVGSTSVPGLAAKPVIDIDVIAPHAALPEVVERLEGLGYVHRGNLGIEGREAFQAPDGLPEHHLYACRAGSLAVHNHLALRDFLRGHPDRAREYGELKVRLAADHPHDIDAYIEGKTALIVSVLAECGLNPDDLGEVEAANRRS